MLRIALIPSTIFFEDHFDRVSVSAAALADGEYRGSWITQYAKLLQGSVRFTLVVPTRRATRTGEVSGALMNVRLIAGPTLSTALPLRFSRGAVRAVQSWFASKDLALEVCSFDALYLQEYAIGRFARVARDVGSLPFERPAVVGFHGTSINQAPGWLSRALPSDLGRFSFTTLTSAEGRSLNDVLGVSAELVRNPVDPAFLESSASRLGSKDVVWVGRIEDKAKGVQLLLATASELCRRRSDITIVVIGDGPDRPLLESALVETPELVRNLRLVGRINGAVALAEVMRGSFALLNTSRVEGFPISVAEALCIGLRCVLTDLPYVRSELSECSLVHRVSHNPILIANELELVRTQMSGIDGVADGREIAAIRRDFDPEVFKTKMLNLFGGY